MTLSRVQGCRKGRYKNLNRIGQNQYVVALPNFYRKIFKPIYSCEGKGKMMQRLFLFGCNIWHIFIRFQYMVNAKAHASQRKENWCNSNAGIICQPHNQITKYACKDCNTKFWKVALEIIFPINTKTAYNIPAKKGEECNK